jgi:hypothetical protein
MHPLEKDKFPYQESSIYLGKFYDIIKGDAVLVLRSGPRPHLSLKGRIQSKVIA